MAWADKPNILSDPDEGPFFVIQSPRWFEASCIRSI